MFVTIRFPTTITGLGRVVSGQILALTGREAVPLIKAANAVPDPYLDELKEKARRLGQNVDWDKQPQHPRATTFANAQEESFGQKLRQAVKERVARRTESERQWRERAAKRRSRYRPPPPRKPTKGA
jgi:hypothetical protein